MRTRMCIPDEACFPDNSKWQMTTANMRCPERPETVGSGLGSVPDPARTVLHGRSGLVRTSPVKAGGASQENPFGLKQFFKTPSPTGWNRASLAGGCARRAPSGLRLPGRAAARRPAVAHQPPGPHQPAERGVWPGLGGDPFCVPPFLCSIFGHCFHSIFFVFITFFFSFSHSIMYISAYITVYD